MCPRDSSFEKLLSGGDRRSIGRSNDAVQIVQKSPARITELVTGLMHEDPRISMRMADALEKVSLINADWLQPHCAKLLKLAQTTDQQEIRWHMAQILPRLRMSPVQRRLAFSVMLSFLEDRSRIVAACALEAIARLAAGDPALTSQADRQIEKSLRSTSPAVQARARLLQVFRSQKKGGTRGPPSQNFRNKVP
jgi:hypothetical protein